jgi:hypothetical protein
MQQLTRRRQRLDQGLCGRCGKKPFVQGTKLCDDCREYHRQYAANEWRTKAGKKKRQQRLTDWRTLNPNRVREQVKAHYYRARKEVFDYYGRVCKCCGENREEFLTIDHINNDGKKDRSNFYKKIVKLGFPDDLQTLCWNCIHAKHIYGVCPHVKEKNDSQSCKH